MAVVILSIVAALVTLVAAVAGLLIATEEELEQGRTRQDNRQMPG